jgi:RsiW-degrading membrane proteinase PrsW (M82 family)
VAVENFISFAFVTVAAVLILGTVVYLVNVGRLLRRLESQHPAVHESIGSPSLFLNNTPRNNLLFFRWIWNRDFKSLDDSKSIALSRLVRSLLLGVLAGLVVMIALFLALSARF